MLYFEQLKLLPVPTPEQTDRFAEHVADNHSWYKHLPFFPPGASFVFFPNPHAGRAVKVEAGRFTVHDLERADCLAYPSQLATADYLAQFGHWDYWVDDNPRAFSRRPGPSLYSANGSDRELLPDNLKEKWSCRLTAFLKAAPYMFRLKPGDLKREAEAFEAAGLIDGKRNPDPTYERYRALAQALPQDTTDLDDASHYAFMSSEQQAQRELLLATLHQVRATWTSELT